MVFFRCQRPKKNYSNWDSQILKKMFRWLFLDLRGTSSMKHEAMARCKNRYDMRWKKINFPSEWRRILERVFRGLSWCVDCISKFPLTAFWCHFKHAMIKKEVAGPSFCLSRFWCCAEFNAKNPFIYTSVYLCKYVWFFEGVVMFLEVF